jgi:hypothetical protein
MIADKYGMAYSPQRMPCLSKHVTACVPGIAVGTASRINKTLITSSWYLPEANTRPGSCGGRSSREPPELGLGLQFGLQFTGIQPGSASSASHA